MISHPNVKVNFGLNILRKRSDGYHDLETLFVPYFGIHDTLEIVKGEDYSATSEWLSQNYSTVPVSDLPGRTGGPAVPTMVQKITADGKLMITIARKEGVDWAPVKDLTARAYGLLNKDFNLPPARIFLEKNTPVGAGLGGGSSDGAFALKMLNELFELGLDDKELARYAAKLGSDCPFFICNRPMFGEGRGEILSPWPIGNIDLGRGEADKDNDYMLRVVVPVGINVSTADAYAGITPKMPDTKLKRVLLRPITEWKDLLVNDFEASVFEKYPRLERLKESLYDSGAIYASMSGSGSALFAIYKKE